MISFHVRGLGFYGRSLVPWPRGLLLNNPSKTTGWRTPRKHLVLSMSPQTESCLDTKFVVTDGTRDCPDDNLKCPVTTKSTLWPLSIFGAERITEPAILYIPRNIFHGDGTISSVPVKEEIHGELTTTNEPCGHLDLYCIAVFRISEFKTQFSQWLDNLSKLWSVVLCQIPLANRWFVETLVR